MQVSDPLSLPQVTILTVTSVAKQATVTAMKASLQNVSFGAARFLSDQDPGPDLGCIEWRKIEPLTSRNAYSRFMLRELGSHFSTKHLLIVQWDGYVLDAGNWDSSFLDYDYIGAPWPQFDDLHRVGNGGFSLRSRRLITALQDFSSDLELPEDVLIGRIWRERLQSDYGIKFAPEDLAQRFSYERTPRRGNEFGFHGVFNMPDIMAPEEVHAMLLGIERGVLGKQESNDLFCLALKRRDWKLAWLSLAKRLAWPRA
ncbi:MAG: DUF5672 family protein [Novosphingobium sp.]